MENKTVVKCSSKEQSQQVISYVRKGEKLYTPPEDKRCINLEDGCHAGEKYYLLEGYKVLSFETFEKEYLDKSPKTEFIPGKWYKTKDFKYYGKFKSIKKPRAYFCVSDAIVSTKFVKDYNFEPGYTWTLLEDLTEIQQYLPEGHPDKIKEKVMNKLIIGEYYSVDGWIFIHVDPVNYKCNNTALTSNTNKYFNGNAHISGLNSSKQAKLATPEEKQWLEACIKADKFVPKEEALKPKEMELIEEKVMKKVEELTYPDVIHIKNKEQWKKLYSCCKNITDFKDIYTYYLIGGGISSSETSYPKEKYNVYEFSDIVFPEEVKYKSWSIKYTPEFTEDIFNHLIIWCDWRILELEGKWWTFTKNRYIDFKEYKYFWFDYRNGRLDSVGVDNNRQSLPEISLNELISIIGYNKQEKPMEKEENWIPKVGEWAIILTSGWGENDSYIGKAYKITKVSIPGVWGNNYCDITINNSCRPLIDLEGNQVVRKALIHEIPMEQEKFNIGEWVVFLPDVAEKLGYSSSTWNEPYILKIDSTRPGSLEFTKETMMKAGYSRATITCSNDIRCFRKALPEEIPSEVPEYVECEGNGGDCRDNFKIGRIYKTIKEENRYLYLLDDNFTQRIVYQGLNHSNKGPGATYFKPSTKEAYDKQQNTPKMEENNDFCVKCTKENGEIIAKWGDKYYACWNGEQVNWYYGLEKGRAYCRSDIFGKLLSTEEFYKKIGHKVEKPRKFSLGKIRFKGLKGGDSIIKWDTNGPNIKHGDIILHKDYDREGAEIVGFYENFYEVKYQDRRGEYPILGFTEDQLEEFSPVSKENNLLEEAKRRYPIGTKYRCVHNDNIYEVKSNNDWSIGKISERPYVLGLGGYVYLEWKSSKWAEIVSEGKKYPVTPDNAYKEVSQSPAIIQPVLKSLEENDERIDSSINFISSINNKLVLEEV